MTNTIVWSICKDVTGKRGTETRFIIIQLCSTSPKVENNSVVHSDSVSPAEDGAWDSSLNGFLSPTSRNVGHPELSASCQEAQLCGRTLPQRPVCLYVVHIPTGVLPFSAGIPKYICRLVYLSIYLYRCGMYVYVLTYGQCMQFYTITLWEVLILIQLYSDNIQFTLLCF